VIKAVAAKFEGKVYWALPPASHDAVLLKIVEETGKSPEGAVQGFVTDKDVFVDRLEAVEVARKADQIDEAKWPPFLYSDDLW